MKRLRDIKLRTQLILLPAIFALFVSLLGMFLFSNVKDILEQKMISSARQTFDYLETEILGYFGNMDDLIDTIASMSSMRQLVNFKDPYKDFQLQNEIKEFTIRIQTITKYNIVGLYINFDNRNLYFGDKNLTFESFSDLELQNGKSFYSRLLSSVNINSSQRNTDASDGLDYYAIVRPMGNYDSAVSKYAGNIAIILNKSYFAQLRTEYQITEGSRTYIINNNNEILGYAGDVPDKSLIGDTLHVLKSPDDFYDYAYKGEQYIACRRVIGDTGWQILSIIPRGEYYSKLYFLTYLAIGLFVVIIILVSLLCLLLAGSITKPVNKLLKIMDKIRRGNLKEKSNLDMKNEIGDLSRHFDIMIEEVYALTRKTFDNQKRLYEMELANRDAQLISLQSQINPHFLYNTLASIQSLAVNNHTEEICEIIASLSNIFRYGVKGSNCVMVASEIENVSKYVKIHQIRTGNKFDFILEIDNEIEDKKIIKLLLQPIVENAIIYGIMKKSGKCTLTIKGYRKDDGLCFEIIDDGIGMDEQELLKLKESLNEKDYDISGEKTVSGIGLKNVKNRLELSYTNCGFNIESSRESGTRVTLSFPAID